MTLEELFYIAPEEEERIAIEAIQEEKEAVIMIQQLGIPNEI